jgi:Rab-like protein 2
VTKKEFKFAGRHNLPFFFVSAADGTNVVKVFHQAIKEAIKYKHSGNDLLSDVLSMLKTSTIPDQITDKKSDAVSL